MMKKEILLASLVLTALLVGCTTVSQPGFSYRKSSIGSTICLVDNTSVKPQMFLSIRRALIDKGFYVRRVEASDDKEVVDCKQILSYEAEFETSWEQSSLRYAKLTLLERSKHDNLYTAQWDERKTSPTLFDKVTDADVEIRQLVDRLFPTDIPWSK